MLLKSRRNQLILALSLVLLILLGGLKLLSTSKRSTSEVAVREVEKEEIKISSQEAHQIAERIIDWLDTMKNDKGQYYVGVVCQPDGSCEQSKVIDKQWGIPVVWARYRNYLNNEDQRNLENLEKDLETLMTPEIGFPAQNDFLNCKLMENGRMERIDGLGVSFLFT